MAVNLSPVGGVAAQFFDNDGNVLSGGKIFTYLAGTSTLSATYTTSAGSIAHTNPIILDSSGRVPGGQVWLTDGIQYKFVIKNSSDTLIGTYDNIVGINDVDASQVSYTPAGIGAQTTNVQEKLRQVVSVLDFIDPTLHAAIKAKTSVVDLSTQLQAAINSVGVTGGLLYIPAGQYCYSTGLTINGILVGLQGDGKFVSILKYTGTGTALKTTGWNDNNANLFSPTISQIQVLGSINAANGIWVSDTGEGSLDNVFVTGFNANGASGVLLSSAVYVLAYKIQDCVIQGNWHNVKLTSPANDLINNINIVKNKIRASVGGHNIYVVSECLNLNIVGNDLEASLLSPVVVAATQSLNIRDNYFETTTAAYAITLGTCNGVNITGNIFGGQPFNAAIVNTGVINSISIQGNSFSTTFSYAMEATAGLANIDMRANSFFGSTQAITAASYPFISNATIVKNGNNLGNNSGLSTFGANGTAGLGVVIGSGTGAINTNIPINQGDAGGTVLLLASRNTSTGTSTESAVYIVRFYYSGNNAPTTSYVGGSSDFVTFSVAASNTLAVTNSGGGTASYSWFGNK
jgi:hypothetical protein